MISKNNKNPHVSIIILNWNGWQDTIECLESVLKLEYDNYNIVLIDNDSTDDSVTQINEWGRGKINNEISTKYKNLVFPHIQKPLKISTIHIDGDNLDEQSMNINIKSSKIILIRNKVNSGFAIANNIGMKIGKRLFDSEYFFLLNNDTVVEPGALDSVINVMENGSGIDVAQSVIYNYNKPTEIANAGGIILFWGQTRYFKKIKKGTLRKISFINGCALAIKKQVVKKYGYLSEKFFFGEEDFEFSMRMKKNNIKMVSVADSIVYHKIGASKNELMKLKKQLFLHGLNRLIDCKDFYSPLIWIIWKEFMLSYYFFTIILRHKFTIYEAFNMIIELRKNSRIYKDVKKNTLESIFSSSKIWKNS